MASLRLLPYDKRVLPLKAFGIAAQSVYGDRDGKFNRRKEALFHDKVSPVLLDTFVHTVSATTRCVSMRMYVVCVFANEVI